MVIQISGFRPQIHTISSLLLYNSAHFVCVHIIGRNGIQRFWLLRIFAISMLTEHTQKKKQKQTIAYLACTILAYGSWWYSFLFPFCVFLLVFFQICVDNHRQWCKLTIRRQYMYMYVFMVSNSVKWKCRQMTEHCSTQKRKKRQWISPFIWWQSLPTNCQLIPHCPHVRNCRRLAHQSPQYGHAKWRFFFCLFASYSISFFFFLVFGWRIEKCKPTKTRWNYIQNNKMIRLYIHKCMYAKSRDINCITLPAHKCTIIYVI